MPREIYTGGPPISGLATSMTDIIGTVPTNEVVQVRVAVTNRSTSSTTLRVSITNGSNTELARRLHDVSIDPGAVLEFDVRLTGGQKLRGQAGAANALDVVIISGVRQF
jgi:hypothetical protein